MPKNYRSPTAAESAKLDAARKMMQEGIEGESGLAARLLPTMAAGARAEQRMAKKMREEVPARAREGEAYNQAGYAKGGKIDGCAKRGKTRGRMV
jgi:hypothetical protein